MSFLTAMRSLFKGATRSSLDEAARPAQPHPKAQPYGFAVVDVETSGLSFKHNRIVEIAVVLTDHWGQIQHEWVSRVNPEGPVGPTHIHGIRDADVRDAPRFTDLVPHVANLIKGRALAAHNASFDLGFLEYEFGRANWAWPSTPHLCTLEHSHYFLPELDRRRLPDCCWAYGIPLKEAHSALGDARATAALVRAFMDPRLGRPPTADHQQLVVRAAAVAWPSNAGQVTPGSRITIPPPQGRATTMRPTSSRFTPSSTVMSLLDSFTLTDAIDEGAPANSLTYLELLSEALEDGVLSVEEREALADLAEATGLHARGIHAAHIGLARALAREALDDGKVTRHEREQLRDLCSALDLPDGTVADLVSGAEEDRLVRLSTGLKPLPTDWSLGEALVIGDRIAFTGCDEARRAALEKRAEKFGIRVMSSVSRRTKLLVTDESFHGTKATAAAALGTRTVDPDTFAALLAHRQPYTVGTKHQPAPRRSVEAPATPSASTLPEPNVTPAEIRAWARERGMEVSVRGRLPREVIEAFTQAQWNLRT